ncbi:long-chain fatty acid--CoA ligase, partial [bacterium]|nr:long-chain fatty acid--CoA ligase [bacterium]
APCLANCRPRSYSDYMPMPSNLDGKTLPEIFLKRVQTFPDDTVFLEKRGGAFQPTRWKDVHAKSKQIYAGLRAAGVEPGDRVAILSNSRPDWFIVDITIQTLGAVTVPIYPSSTPEDVAFVLEHSGAKILFAEDAGQIPKLEAVFALCTHAVPVVFFNENVPTTRFESVSYNHFLNAASTEGVAEEQARTAQAIRPEDLASIVFTSGTTGRPKGARLLHRCLATEIRSIVHEVDLSSADTTLTYLPFAHVLGRVESLMPIMSGISLAFAENINAIPHNLMEVKPTILLSVPRIFEKIYARIQSDLEAGPGYQKDLFNWAVSVGRQGARARALKQPISLPLQVKLRVADRLVFGKVRSKLGGRLRYTVSGGAPLSPDLCEFFHACGIHILEGYGLTETTAAIACNRPDDYRFATVGRPIAETDFRIADDGEIQVRGPAIFDGYFNDEEATRQAVTADGWFCTGDIGEFDEKGFLKITDRKKELIVTSGGKNIAPQKIENAMKQIPLVSNALVYGDKQKYLVALVTLSEPEAKRWAKGQGVQAVSLKDLAEAPKIREYIEAGIKRMNQSLASYETVKRFEILPNDFSVEEGEITPSLKLKRKVVHQRYGEVLTSMYH